MSGGIDSSVTALLLAEDGWDVLGITMKIPALRETDPACRGADAALVCHQIGVPHYYADVRTDFNALVVDGFKRDYAAGRTPNPCVDCNTRLKFGLLWDFIRAEFGIRFLASGHYARIIRTENGARLAAAADRNKDQSYFLCGIPAQRLADLMLPMGELTKQQARKIASGRNLHVAEKAESMELCFAVDGDYRGALTEPEYNRPGSLTDTDGNVIGTHRGIANYTIGQRRGLGFAGGKPLYVARIDAATNTVTLGTRDRVLQRTVTAEDTNILFPERFAAGGRLLGKIRSYGRPQPCKIHEADKNHVTAVFDKPQFAPCSGQRLVLYDENDFVAAAGTIVAEKPAQDLQCNPSRRPRS
jgi:tRNA-specific 2-thiouridylase